MLTNPTRYSRSFNNFQNGVPSLSFAFAGINCCLPGFLSRKSKIPCFPGFFPVIIEDQAVGVWAGKVDSSTPREPFSSNQQISNLQMAPRLPDGDLRWLVARRDTERAQTPRASRSRAVVWDSWDPPPILARLRTFSRMFGGESQIDQRDTPFPTS